MGYRVVEFQSTPNPNAIKCVLDRSPGDRPRSYRDPAAADGDPLARALFAIHGVTGLLIHDGWITVNKADKARWTPIRAGVERALRDIA
ncbi:MAG: NifU N-terminal domain-containing protein [Phycisphaerales bacterium]|nr:NifU N-terminal domain-containing protein [Phycisphaerales bacterium]